MMAVLKPHCRKLINLGQPFLKGAEQGLRAEMDGLQADTAPGARSSIMGRVTRCSEVMGPAAHLITALSRLVPAPLPPDPLAMSLATLQQAYKKTGGALLKVANTAYGSNACTPCTKPLYREKHHRTSCRRRIRDINKSGSASSMLWMAC